MGMIESVPSKNNQDGDDGDGGDVDRYGDDEAEDVPLRPMEEQASVGGFDHEIFFNQSHFQGNSVNRAQCALCTV